MEALLLSLAGDFAKEISPAKIAESVVIFLFAWSKVKATVNESLTKFEAKLDILTKKLEDLSTNVKEANAALVKVEVSHAKAISNLKDDVTKINSRLEAVEKKP